MTSFIEWDFLTDFIEKAFAAYGVPQEDAKICTDILLQADKKGIESHGVNRFKLFISIELKQVFKIQLQNSILYVKRLPLLLLMVMTAWDKSLVINQCSWQLIKPKNMAWAWSQ